ncbi:hypothetical protein GCK32_011916 [Trichostrongylus colubriformis]|uniref:Uncharacterized protein n=1 Tax=Trichostrongylus colubriformis TaxID=6319 RepID=A0AAN8IUJ9_TRICO
MAEKIGKATPNNEKESEQCDEAMEENDATVTAQESEDLFANHGGDPRSLDLNRVHTSRKNRFVTGLFCTRAKWEGRQKDDRNFTGFITSSVQLQRESVVPVFHHSACNFPFYKHLH